MTGKPEMDGQLRTLGLLERLRAEPKVPTPISTTAWTRSCASW